MRSGSINRFQEVVFFRACFVAMWTFAGKILCGDRYGVSAIRTHAVLRVLKLLDTGKNHYRADSKPDDSERQEEQAE